MLTQEIIKFSKEDGLTYESSFGKYNDKDGFQFNEKGKEYLRYYPNKFIKMLFTDDTIWQVAPEPPKKMTMQEIRDALGYDFEITDKPKQDYNPVNDLIDLIFGKSGGSYEN